jgi:hypothetical protein
MNHHYKANTILTVYNYNVSQNIQSQFLKYYQFIPHTIPGYKIYVIKILNVNAIVYLLKVYYKLSSNKIKYIGYILVSSVLCSVIVTRC